MTHYLRTNRSTDAQAFGTADDAIKQVHANIARQKAFGRVVSREGERILFHEKTGELFDGMWVEHEDGEPIHIPIE